jgi:histidinol-phosphate/aromatic aminotransferase/cobyric acid decarboxylase-like protein
MGFSVDVSRLDNRCHTPSAAVLHRGSERDAALNDFCVPVNAYFPTPEMLRQLHAKLEHVLKYYPDENRNIAEVVAENFDLEPGNVVMGNGSTELIAWIHRVWEMKRLMTPVPTFGRWTDYPLENGTCVQFHQRREDELFQLNVDRLLAETRALGCTAVAICNPNNPTGRLTDRNRLLELLDRLADLELIVIDESFLDFAGIDDVPTMIHEAVKRSNVIVLKSLGKNFGLHGMRAGYAVTNPHWAEKLRRAVPAWNVNAVAELIIRSGFEQQDAYQASR